MVSGMSSMARVSTISTISRSAAPGAFRKAAFSRSSQSRARSVAIDTFIESRRIGSTDRRSSVNSNTR